MHPVLLNIGNFNLYTYGLFAALGFMTAVWVSQKNAATHDISPQAVTDIFFVILVSALFGARLLYVLINFNNYKDNWLDIFKIWNGGLVFFGGFLGAVIASFIYMKMQNFNTWKTADLLSPGVALGHALGRLGCFFAGCCYGKICDLPFAIKFTNPESLAPLEVYLHPTQIYSVLSNFILFFILMGIQKKKKFNGMVFLTYIMLYSLFRFIIEFFRGDFRGNFIFDSISMSQGIGLMVFFIALIILIKQLRPFYGSK
ncbi:MAG: prolipoprotein diacylglyceryl transferase [Desulfobacula sp.]|jgi:phosphatidylglycerol:prolipoprotein diacylglycerol transferase|uniref:prolipoprotein diacylglyceryl transferase n=1 Tax=Desulfobacula sp. TaxID=2593537 RepID=UPI001D959EDE|nr:prolipoprotein diacylglyceryl transferase [Desulfobacula sp.]MBT3806751.1 prolipoprotein diacylglyceryl transferase [Desulfobacula sp.]MBT4200764.1 prolipoprotein diacylglyceryl transferase [Desulfobacula sp.]MBT4508779.1 prolipoprotein diacylglyceryl transferase [Desulfobacula sp.]MBT4874037.1 prolipoprotein diacylglyceryl transferase [Desulfobacula sp.]